MFVKSTSIVHVEALSVGISHPELDGRKDSDAELSEGPVTFMASSVMAFLEIIPSVRAQARQKNVVILIAIITNGD